MLAEVGDPDLGRRRRAVGGEGGDYLDVTQSVTSELVGKVARQQADGRVKLIGSEEAEHVGGDTLAEARALEQQGAQLVLKPSDLVRQRKCSTHASNEKIASQNEESSVEFGSDRSLNVEVAIVPRTDANDSELVAQIVDLVNRMYADAEKGLWLDGADRTNARAVATMVSAGELVVARLDGRLVGAVRIQRLDGGRGELGMLVASPEHRGVGIGRKLVAFAEGWAREQGLGPMQLELLVPQTWAHPVKEFLRDWYTRLGYQQVRTGRLEEAYPALQSQLATPCDFAIYHKNL